MTIARRFDELVSGRQRGPSAAFLRAALRTLEAPYTTAIHWRNALYDRAPGAVQRASVPVISVGNLTMGGTGKTPMVVWLAKWMLSRNVTPVIVSRGYRSRRGQLNDEGEELRALLPDVAHVQNPDRVSAAQVAIDQQHAEVIILDDGFQHRRLHRDLNLALVDAQQPFGYDHVFPRGTLREPLSGLGRADVVVLTRSDTIEGARREKIRERVAQLAPTAVWSEAVHQPVRFRNLHVTRALDSFRGRRVAAFAGIGQPPRLRETLQRCGCDVVGFREFPDHYQYLEADIDELARWAHRLDVTAVVCTGKDLVKIQHERCGDLPFWALEIALRVNAGASQLEQALARIVAKAPQSTS